MTNEETMRLAACRMHVARLHNALKSATATLEDDGRDPETDEVLKECNEALELCENDGLALLPDIHIVLDQHVNINDHIGNAATRVKAKL